MTTTDTPPRKEVRQEIREIMAQAPDRRFTVEMIHTRVNQLHNDLPVPFELCRDHLEWNFQRGFVDFRHNHELGRDEYFLTDKGKHQEGVN